MITYLDESLFSHDMPRRYGYAIKGKRCLGKCDWNAQSRTNVIEALVGKKLLTEDLFDTNISSKIFYQWTVQSLLPKLSASSVGVLDNATFHKQEYIRNAIKNAGRITEFLAPYLPEQEKIG